MLPAFDTWERATLDKFALDAYERLLVQEDLIQQLNSDLKAAIKAYRELITAQAPSRT